MYIYICVCIRACVYIHICECVYINNLLNICIYHLIYSAFQRTLLYITGAFEEPVLDRVSSNKLLYPTHSARVVFDPFGTFKLRVLNDLLNPIIISIIAILMIDTSFVPNRCQFDDLAATVIKQDAIKKVEQIII